MTYREVKMQLIKLQNQIYKGWSNDIELGTYEHYEALDYAIESLEGADMYRWHDLRKNPKDLPNESTWCVCMLDKVFADEWVNDNFVYAVGKYGTHWTKKTSNNVIAWKELEPFEVEE